MLNKPLLCLLVLTSLVLCVHNYNILMAVGDMTSHLIYAGRLAERLRHGGHDVTLLLPSNMKTPNDVWHLDINVTTFYNPDPPIMQRENIKALNSEMTFHPSFFLFMKMIDQFINATKASAACLFKDKKAMEAVQGGNYDFVIVDHVLRSYLLIPYKLGKPYAYLAPECMGPLRRIPIMPSHVPFLFTSFSDKMSFQQRVINFILYTLLTFINLGGHDESREYVPERPEVGFNDLYLNASLCLQLRENVIDFIRPEMPDVIPVAYLMAREAKPLLVDLQSYMDQATNGVILVSFGSLFTELPLHAIHRFFKVFEMTNCDIIFKYSNAESLMQVPANVRVMSWVPQNDLLAHPNLKLFITHAGLNSIIETIYHAVPVISFPHGIDQFSNAALAKSKGFGEVLFLPEFTSEQLHKLIDQVLTDKRYSSAAKKLSIVFRETMANSHKDPVYWIEHVIKFGDSHLRSHAREMPVFQYMMIDVIAFLVLTTFVFTAVFLYICRCLITRVCFRRKTKVE